MTEIERIDALRDELNRHNYNYYVLNAPEISDHDFDMLMKELEALEAAHPEHYDKNSPTQRVAAISTPVSSRRSISTRCCRLQIHIQSMM